MNLFGEPDDIRGTRQRGHAGIPGTGPAGETCRTCKHYCLVGGHAKDYRKCGLMRHAWTGGPGTDIRAKDPACKLWDAEIRIWGKKK